MFTGKSNHQYGFGNQNFKSLENRTRQGNEIDRFSTAETTETDNLFMFSPEAIERDIPKYENVPIVNNTTSSGNSIMPDGKFSDNVFQQTTGDCVVLSKEVLALNQTNAGKEVLDKLITFDENGKPIVHFLETGDEYKMEKNPRRIGNQCLALGDRDYNLIENAMNKHIQTKHPNHENMKENPNNPINGGFNPTDPVLDELTGTRTTSERFNASFTSNLYLTDDHLKLLTRLYGNEPDELKKQIAECVEMDKDLYFENSITDEHLDELAKKLKTGEILGITAGRNSKINPVKKEENPSIISEHCYAIKNINPEEKTVTVINPWNATKPKTMSYSKFEDQITDLALIQRKYQFPEQQPPTTTIAQVIPKADETPEQKPTIVEQNMSKEDNKPEQQPTTVAKNLPKSNDNKPEHHPVTTVLSKLFHKTDKGSEQQPTTTVAKNLPKTNDNKPEQHPTIVAQNLPKTDKKSEHNSLTTTLAGLFPKKDETSEQKQQKTTLKQVLLNTTYIMPTPASLLCITASVAASMLAHQKTDLKRS